MHITHDDNQLNQHHCCFGTIFHHVYLVYN